MARSDSRRNPIPLGIGAAAFLVVLAGGLYLFGILGAYETTCPGTNGGIDDTFGLDTTTTEWPPGKRCAVVDPKTGKAPLSVLENTPTYAQEYIPGTGIVIAALLGIGGVLVLLSLLVAVRGLLAGKNEPPHRRR